MKKINKLIKRLLSPITLLSRDEVEIELLWTLLTVGYMKEESAKDKDRVHGYWLFALLGVGVVITDYNKDYKHTFHNIDITSDLEYLDFDNKLVYIENWETNIDMKRTILSVSGYITTTGNAVVTGIYYKKESFD